MEGFRRTTRSMSKIRSSNNNEENIMFRLPEHLLLLCIARVSISSYKTMSGVCRAWREMLRKKLYWETRRDLNVVEELIFFGVHNARTFRSTASDKVICSWNAFEPFSNTWIRIPAMPEDGRAPGTSACATFDGKFFVIGGELKHSALSCRTVTYFDTSQFCWKMAAPLVTPRSSCKVGVIENKLYVFGGFTCYNTAAGRDRAAKGNQNTRRDQASIAISKTAEIYDPIVKSWRLVSAMKVPTQLNYSIAMDGKFLAIGTSGMDLGTLRCGLSDWTKTENVMGIVYDPQTNQWTRMAHGLMEGWQRRMVVVKGRLYSALCVFSIGVYDSDRGRWKPVHVSWPSDDLEWDTCRDGVPFYVRRMSGWSFELLNLGGRLCMVALKTIPHEVVVIVLEMEEHSSKGNGITICGNVLLFKNVMQEISDSGFYPEYWPGYWRGVNTAVPYMEANVSHNVLIQSRSTEVQMN